MATGQVGDKPSVCIWDLGTGALKTKLSLGRGMRACKALAWSKDSKRVYACALDNDHTVFGLDSENGKVLWSEKVIYPINCLLMIFYKNKVWWRTSL